MGEKLGSQERKQVIIDRLRDRSMAAPTFRDIADQFSRLSDKTIRRDMEELKKMGADIRIETRRRRTTYCLAGDFSLPGAFSAADLLNLTILRQAVTGYSGAYLEKQFDQLEKQANRIAKAQRDFSRAEIDAAITFRPPGCQPVDPEIWETVLMSTLSRSALECQYSGRRGKDLRMTIWPYHMVSSGGDWYLMAGSPDDRKPSQYALARMANVRRASKPDHFKLPVGFDAKRLLDQSFGGFFSTGPVKTVRVHVTGYMVDYLRNRVLQPKQKVSTSADGKSMEISFLAGSSGPVPFGNVVAWVLGMGPCAKVLEPPELIERVKKEARELLKQYR